MTTIPSLINPATIDNSLLTAITTNNTTLTTAINDTLSRSGIQPNVMNSNLDMNNNQIINLPAPATLNSPARLIDVQPGTVINVNTPPTGTSGHTVPYLDGGNTWSGTNTFQANILGLSAVYAGSSSIINGTGTAGVFGSIPNFVFYNASDSTNQHYWSLQAVNGGLNFYTINDTLSTVTAVMSMVRSGNNVSQVIFPTAILTVGQNGISSGTLQLPGSSSGFATLTAGTNGSLLINTPSGTIGAIGITGSGSIATWNSSGWVFGQNGGISGLASWAGSTSGFASITVSGTGGTMFINTGTTIDSSGNIRTLDLYTNDANFIIRATTSLNNAAAGNTATLTNAPVAGNPTKWISFDDAGVTRRIPTW